MTRNAELDIKGILVVDEEKTLQVLEGDESSALHLFDKIAADPRHQNVQRGARVDAGLLRGRD